MEIKVAKFTLYPKDEPTGYAVGFQCKFKNGETFYQDTIIPLDLASGKTEDEVMNLAWDFLKETFIRREEKIKNKPKILNKTFCMNPESKKLECLKAIALEPASEPEPGPESETEEVITKG